MWDKSDQRFITFWHLTLPLLPYLVMAIGFLAIGLGVGWLVKIAFADAFSNEAHFVDWTCLPIVVLTIGGFLTIVLGKSLEREIRP